MKRVVSSDERGAGLVEILISVAIIAIVLTTFLAALSTATWGVATVRERVTAQNLARRQLECIQDHPYIDKALPLSYTTACTVTALSSYPMEVSISYWISPTFVTTPTVSGMQWITVTVYHHSDPVFTIGKYKADR